MAFNYFRLCIVALASFAAFFAYICRLNLSLTIDEMVVVDDFQGKDPESFKYNTMDADTLNSPLMNEEQALAWFSRSLRRQLWTSKAQARRQANRTAKLLSKLDDDLFALSIDLTGETTLKPDPEKQPDPSSSILDTNTGGIRWSENDRDRLLGAFFFGYVIAQIPCARSAEVLGAKSMLLLTGFGASLCSFVFPTAAKLSDSIIYAYIVRLLLGATQAALFPACYVLLCEWLPENERSTWLAYPSASSRVGTIAMNFVLPIVLRNYDWEAVFYASGAVTLVWCIVFFIFGSNKPESSWWISKAELLYIDANQAPKPSMKSLEPQITASGFTINESPESIKTRSASIGWIKIIKNRPIMILTLVMFSSEWANMILLIKLPGFLGPVLKMDIAEIGSWSSVLIAIYCVQYPFSSFCASKLDRLECISSLTVRKIFEFSSQAMQGIGCLIIAFTKEKFVVLAALSLMMFGRSTVGGGQCLMPPELSKEYPGTVFAYANSLANIAGFMGPLTVSWMVKDRQDGSAWSNLFILSAAIFFICGIVFCLLADNQDQDLSRKPKLGDKVGSLSKSCLTPNQDIEKEFKMDAFQRLGREPTTVSSQPGSKEAS